MSPWPILIVLAAALAACGTPRVTQPVSPPPGLLPLPTRTPLAAGVTSTVRSPATPGIIATATPTATPVTHIVTEGESLLSIALDYGVSVQALQAANPNVQVRFLSIGALLEIPPPEGPAAVHATRLAAPPPMPLALSDPACYPTDTGSLYCLVEVSNPLEGPAENISARVTLAGQDGVPLAHAVGFAGIDLVAGGETAPLAVVFQPAPSAPIAAYAVELLTADPAAASVETGRALLLEVVEQTGQAAGSRLTVSGQVRNSTGHAAGTAYVTVTAYGADNTVVGYRRHRLQGGLAVGAVIPFSLVVDSLAGPIEHYALAAEGRP